MADQPKSTGPSIWLAAPGVIACLGIVWLGVRLSSMEARLSPSGAAAQATAAVNPSPSPSAGSAPATPTAQQPAAPTPAKLDASAVAKFWKDAIGTRVMTQCRSGNDGGALQSLELTLLIDAAGVVLDVRVEPTERAKAAGFYDCVVGSLRSIQFPAPGKLVQGKVSLPAPASK